jgi:predicted Zn-dependent peptidase
VAEKAVTPWVAGTLPCGLRWVHQETAAPTGHIGLIVRAGTRDEGPDEPGLAHFIEHLLFKGTVRRKPFHLLSKIEDAGGELNAYTGKEDTTVYASFLAENYPAALDVLLDIAFRSVFPEKELKKEQEVIADEIDAYLDAPSELIFDDFEELLFAGHALGHNILGTKESLQTFTREQVLRFVRTHYVPANMVLSSVGRISAARLERLLLRLTADVPESLHAPVPHRTPAPSYAPVQKTGRDTHQCHVVLGSRAVSVHDPALTTGVLLNNVLGGPAMSSRLNLNIRERYGIAYQIESFFTPYSDTGLQGVYVGTDSDAVDRAVRLIHKELRQLREVPLGVVQLAKAKQQLLGQMALAQESPGAWMTALGRSYLLFNRMETFDELRAKVHAVTAQDVRELANRWYDPAQLTTLVYEPTDEDD